MIKLAFCLRRKSGMSREAFQDYWLNRHAPLVKSCRSAIGFSRYVQFHTGFDALSAKAAAFRNSPTPFDGIAELWWPSEAAMRAAATTPEARAAFAALYADEQHFIDLASSPMWYGVEHVIHDGG